MKERNLRHSVSEPVSASRSELCSFYPVQSQTHVGYMSYIIRIIHLCWLEHEQSL